MKSLLIIISTIVAVLLILAGVGYFLLSKPSPTEPPPQGAAPSEQLAPNFEQKIEEVKKAIADVCATGESKELTLVFTETEANNQAAKLLAQVEIPEDIPLEIKGVHIDFQTDNNIVTEVRGVTYGFKVAIKVKAQVDVEEGKPEVEVTNVSFGAVPLPKPLKDKINDLITQKIDDLQSQLAEAEIECNGKVDLEFTDINIQQSQVIITVIIKLRA